MSVRRFLTKALSILIPLAGYFGGACMLSACGDYYEYAIVPTTMTLEQHTMTLMVGDSAVIRPLFTPDSLSNNTVFWYSLDPDVATFVSADTIVAQTIGTTQAVAIAVIDYTQIDTCTIEVIDRWVFPENDYPHETVVYADVTIHGEPATEDDIIAAFIGGEVRGIGQMFEKGGHRVMRIRVAGDLVDEDEMEQQSIIFCCYRRRQHIVETFPQAIYYDGEAHGTPSKPFQLQIP